MTNWGDKFSVNTSTWGVLPEPTIRTNLLGRIVRGVVYDPDGSSQVYEGEVVLIKVDCGGILIYVTDPVEGRTVAMALSAVNRVL
jgi:hypothetical protein